MIVLIDCIPYLLSHMHHVRCRDLLAHIYRNTENPPTKNFEAVDQQLY